MKRKAALALMAVGAAGVYHTGTQAATVTWTGGGGDTNLGNPANWDGTPPTGWAGASNTVVFGSNAPASFTRPGAYTGLIAQEIVFSPSGNLSLERGPNPSGAYAVTLTGSNTIRLTTPHTVALPSISSYGGERLINIHVAPGGSIELRGGNGYAPKQDIAVNGGGSFTISNEPVGGYTYQNDFQVNGGSTLGFVPGSYFRAHVTGMITGSGGSFDLTRYSQTGSRGIQLEYNADSNSTGGISPGAAPGATAKFTFNGATGGGRDARIHAATAGVPLIMDIVDSAGAAGTGYDQLALNTVQITTGDIANFDLTLNVADYAAGGTPVSVPIIVGDPVSLNGISAASFHSVTGLPAGASIRGTADGSLFIDYTAAPVPEPTTLGVLALGGMALLGRRRRS